VIDQTNADARPLRRFQVLQDAHLQAFEASACSLLTPCRLTPTLGSTEAGLLGEASTVRLGPVRLVYVRNAGAGLNVQLLQPEAFYDINFALEGINRVETTDDQVVLSPQRAGIISPQMVAAMQLSDGYGQLHVRIERSALEQHLERMLDAPVTHPIRFRMEMDLSAPAVASWARVIQLLVDDLDEPSGLTAAGADGNPWSEFLMNGLLLAQPHNYSELLARGRADILRPPTVKRVIDLIEREPGEDLSMARLTAAAGIGSRALQRNFREYVGTSPQEYVRWVRLGRVHDDLSAGVGGTVAEIAFRWGFTHMSRFAGAYRERYGVAPSATLHAAPPAQNGGPPVPGQTGRGPGRPSYPAQN
jgi:AraC-like DNA-binding protein